MIRIPQLPKWCLTNAFPAFHDYESLSAVDQTARLYATMQCLIDDYNKFAKEISNSIETFCNDLNADQECFKNEINKIVHDYIIVLDEKVAHQDRIIEESIVYIKNNIVEVANNIINEKIEDGTIQMLSTYDEANKKLSLIIKEV